MDNIKDKMNKDEFLQRVSKRAEIEQESVDKVYDAIISEIKDVVCSGRKLSLTRFGTFSLREHKGHPVQYDFSKTEKPSDNPDNEAKSISDYVVFKFDVSAVFMNQIREQCDENKLNG